MDSEGLKHFLKTVGDSIFLLNTICVGLDGVGSGAVKKSENLTVSWHTNNPENAALQARAHAIKSTLIFVEEALLEYISFLGKCTNQTEEIKTASRTDGAAEKIIQISQHLKDAPEYWEPMVILLVRWRNKVVHGSAVDLSQSYRSILNRNSNVIKDAHAAISIEKTLKHFDEGQITLKDFSTMIAITIRYVRKIDTDLTPKINDIISFSNIIKNKNLTSIYKKIVGVNGIDIQERKFYKFIDINFHNMSPEEKDLLFKRRHEIKNLIQPHTDNAIRKTPKNHKKK